MIDSQWASIWRHLPVRFLTVTYHLSNLFTSRGNILIKPKDKGIDEYCR